MAEAGVVKVKRGKYTDSKGRSRRGLSSQGNLYKLARIEHADWSLKACAIEAGVPEKRANASANRWEHHPEMEGTVKLLAKHDLGAAVKSREKWFEQVDKDRAFAIVEHNPSVAHEATKTYGKAAGYLDKEQAIPPQPLIGQVNLNVILANPESRRALEAVVRVMEGQPGGDGGQVVAGTVAQS